VNRLVALDWLRGLLALAIMLYHLTGWTLYEPGAESFLGRLGIYGVSMFFVLSGLSMAAGYHRSIVDLTSSMRFFVRRLFRIWPLLWLAIACATIGGVIKGRSVDWVEILLNVTTLFGFVSPGAYINTGAWSIGNEMVYYAVTPPILMAFSMRRWLGNLIVSVAALPALYIAFGALSPARTLAEQWLTYIHPANNLILYLLGVGLFYNCGNVKLPSWAALGAILFGVIVFLGVAFRGDLILVVTGWPRIVFCCASALVVLGFYKLQIELPSLLSRPLVALGAATYGVYLLHPLVYQVYGAVTRGLKLPESAPATISITVVVTIAVSLLVYERLEAPLIRLGKRLTPTHPQAN
jgi:exopolysaccharide production protein ExoZ